MVWLVGLTNAFNLLDNMDGLCAGTALVVAVMLMVGLATGASSRLRAARDRVSRRAGRRGDGVPGLQLSAGVDLHGRQRRADAGFRPRDADARQ